MAPLVLDFTIVFIVREYFENVHKYLHIHLNKISISGLHKISKQYHHITYIKHKNDQIKREYFSRL